MHVTPGEREERSSKPLEGWDEDACLHWLWRERFSPDGSHAMCDACRRERRFHRLRGRRAFGCDTCGYQIYPTAGTPFERSRTPLATWFRAVRMLVGPDPAEPGDLRRELGLSPAASRRLSAKLFAALAESGPHAGLILRLNNTLTAGVPPDKPPQLAAAAQLSRPKTVDLIRAAACRAFAENGVDGTRIADIAEEAGLSTGIIHYHFRHKDEVLLAALQWANEQITHTLERLGEQRGRSIDRIALMLQLSIPYEGLLRDEMLLWLEVWVRARQRPALVSESYAISQTWHREMAQAIQRGIDEGAVHPVAAADEIAHRLIAAANGLGFKAAVGHGGIRAREVRRLLFRLAAEQLGVPVLEIERAADIARSDGATATRPGGQPLSPVLAAPRVRV